ASDRCVYAKFRPRITVENRMRVADKIFDAGLFQQLLDSGLVSAFGQPDAARLTTEMLLVIRDGDLDLPTPGFTRRDQWQKSVRSTASDDLEDFFFLELAKRIDQISLIPVVPKRERRSKIFEIHFRDVVKLDGFRTCPVDFLFSELDQVFEVASIT